MLQGVGPRAVSEHKCRAAHETVEGILHPAPPFLAFDALAGEESSLLHFLKKTEEIPMVTVLKSAFHAN